MWSQFIYLWRFHGRIYTFVRIAFGTNAEYFYVFLYLAVLNKIFIFSLMWSAKLFSVINDNNLQAIGRRHTDYLTRILYQSAIKIWYFLCVETLSLLLIGEQRHRFSNCAFSDSVCFNECLTRWFMRSRAHAYWAFIYSAFHSEILLSADCVLSGIHSLVNEPVSALGRA